MKALHSHRSVLRALGVAQLLAAALLSSACGSYSGDAEPGAGPPSPPPTGGGSGGPTDAELEAFLAAARLGNDVLLKSEPAWERIRGLVKPAGARRARTPRRQSGSVVFPAPRIAGNTVRRRRTRYEGERGADEIPTRFHFSRFPPAPIPRRCRDRYCPLESKLFR